MSARKQPRRPACTYCSRQSLPGTPYCEHHRYSVEDAKRKASAKNRADRIPTFDDFCRLEDER